MNENEGDKTAAELGPITTYVSLFRLTSCVLMLGFRKYGHCAQDMLIHHCENL